MTAAFFASDKLSASSAVTVVAEVHRADHDLNLEEVLGSTDAYFTDLLNLPEDVFSEHLLDKDLPHFQDSTGSKVGLCQVGPSVQCSSTSLPSTSGNRRNCKSLMDAANTTNEECPATKFFKQLSPVKSETKRMLDAVERGQCPHKFLLCPPNFVAPRKICFKHIVKAKILSPKNVLCPNKSWNLATSLR